MLFEKNMRVLGSADPALLERISTEFAKRITSQNNNSIRWEKDRSGRALPYVKAENGSMARLCSKYSVYHETDAWFEQFDAFIQKNSLIYMFGFGTGDAVRKALSRISEDGAVAVYEPNAELFFQLMERVDLTDILSAPNVHIFLPKINDDRVVSFIRDFCAGHWILPDNIVIMALPSYQRLYPKAGENFSGFLSEWYIRMETSRQTACNFLQDLLVTPLQKLYYFQNAILMEYAKKDWNRDIPVLMVAGGPSLQKHLKFLHKVKGHMLIAAVDRIAPVLQEEGIVPDIVASIDSINTFITTEESFKNVPLLCADSTNKESFDWSDGEKIIIPYHTLIQTIRDKAGLPKENFSAAGSVAIAIVAFFVMLGTKHIILIGQDLAFAEDGKSHVNDSEGGMDNEMTLPGYNGGTVLTRPDWYGFWSWYVRSIPKMKDTRIINSTEAGAHIPGTLQMPLSEALEKYGVPEIDMSFLKNDNYRVSEEKYAAMKEELEHMRREIEQLFSWTEEDFTKKRETLQQMDVGPWISQLIYNLLEEANGIPWESFQMVLAALRENGWTGKENG